MNQSQSCSEFDFLLLDLDAFLGLRRGRVEHGGWTGPHGTPGPAASHGLLVIEGVHDLSVIGGREIHGGDSGAGAVVVQPGRP